MSGTGRRGDPGFVVEESSAAVAPRRLKYVQSMLQRPLPGCSSNGRAHRPRPGSADRTARRPTPAQPCPVPLPDPTSYGLVRLRPALGKRSSWRSRARPDRTNLISAGRTCSTLGPDLIPTAPQRLDRARGVGPRSAMSVRVRIGRYWLDIARRRAYAGHLSDIIDGQRWHSVLDPSWGRSFLSVD